MNILIRTIYLSLWGMLWLPHAGLWGQPLVEQEVNEHRIQKIEGKLYLYQDGAPKLLRVDHFEFDQRGNLVQREQYDSTARLQVAMEAGFDLFQHQTYRQLATPERGLNDEVQWELFYQEGRLVAEQDDNLGLLRQYAYDEEGRVTQIRISLGGETPPISIERFRYDEAGRLHQHSEQSEMIHAVTTISYDSAGRRSRVCERKRYQFEDRPERQRCERYQYDEAGQLVQVTRQIDERAPLHIHYRYDAAGRLIEQSCGPHRISYQRNAEGLILLQKRHHGDVLVYQRVFSYRCWDGTYVAGR